MGLEWVWGLLQPGFVRWAPPCFAKPFNHWDQHYEWPDGAAPSPPSTIQYTVEWTGCNRRLRSGCHGSVLFCSLDIRGLSCLLQLSRSAALLSGVRAVHTSSNRDVFGRLVLFFVAPALVAIDESFSRRCDDFRIQVYYRIFMSNRKRGTTRKQKLIKKAEL